MRHSQLEWKENIKKNILTEINNKDLTTISLSDNQDKIFWEEKGKEFSFNGEMYDVVKTVTLNGKKVLYCIKDNKEQQVVDNFNSVTKQNSSAGKKLLKVDNLPTLFVYDNDLHFNFFNVQALNQYHNFSSNLPQSILQNVSPPPKA